VYQSLAAPVVGSTQALCQKLVIFWPYFAISSIINYSTIQLKLLILLLGFLSVSGNSSLDMTPSVHDTPDISFMVLGISLVILSSVVHCLTFIPSILPRLWWFLFWSFCQLTNLSARIFFNGIALLRRIGGSFLSTTHYQNSKNYFLLLIYIAFLWSFSWYFGSLRNCCISQPIIVSQPNISMPLVPDKYIYKLYEPPDYALESLIQHHSNAANNYYRGFTYLSTRVYICLYIKYYSLWTSSSLLLYNPWTYLTSYWLGMAVLLAACTFTIAGSIHWLYTVVFWPAPHAGGETYSAKWYALMMRARNARNVDDVIILDNGASRTYLSIFEWLTNPMPCNGTVTSANGVKSRSTHIGSLGKLPTVLFSPDMAFNLLSQRDLEKGQLEFYYKQGVCTIYRPDIPKPIMQIMVSEDDLYKMSYDDAVYLCNHLDSPTLVANLVKQDMSHYADHKHEDMSTLIHGRLIHMNLDTIRKAIRTGHIKGLDKYLPNLQRQHFCRFCAMSKSTTKTCKGHHEHDNYKFGECLYSDVCGPFRVRTKSGCRYFITYICGKTRYAWVFLVKRKSEQTRVFKNLVTNILPQYGVKVKVLFSDNGGEYTSDEFMTYCHRSGIQTLHTAPRTPEQNGICERFNRTLVEALRTVLLTSCMARSFWGEFVLSITYIRNHLPHSSLPDDMSPIEAAFGTVPDVSRFRTLGCDCYTILDTEGNDKLLIKANPSTLLGYTADSLSYRVLIWATGKVANSRNVVFDEEAITNGAMSGVANPYIVNNERYEEHVDRMLDPRIELLNGADDDSDSDDDDTSPRNITPPDVKNEVFEEMDDVSPRPRRTVHPINRLNYDRLGGVLKELSEAGVVSDYGAYKATNFKEMNLKLEDLCLSAMETALAFYDDLLNANIPRNPDEAMHAIDAAEWSKSMQLELDALNERGVWVMVKDEGQYCHDTKWVYKRKYADDLPVKWRSRLVLRGFKQKITEDYFETFSPVLRKESLRLFFALCVWFDFECDQTDVNVAFPYADLEEVIHIKPPIGVNVPRGYVLRLRKALYGLKQAPRAWYQLMTSVLLHFGFTKCVSDPCIYFYKVGNDMIIVGVYVDDILIAGNSRVLINEVKRYIEEHFQIKDLGPVKTMLGINISHNIADGLLTMDQSKMIIKIVTEFQPYNDVLLQSDRGKEMKVRDVETTPMVPGLVLSSASDLPEDKIGDPLHVDVSKLPYMRLVGYLLYVMTCTRPDISFATTVISRFMTKPLYIHWLACLHLVRYLKGTTNVGICFYRDNWLEHFMVGFSDSDWASSDLEHRRSMTGYSVFLCGGPIAWRSCLQTTVAKSATEAEYYALSNCIDEVTFMKQLLSELGIEIETVPIYEDNKGAVDLAGNPVYHKRVKHIDIRYHSIREKVADGTVIILKIPTRANFADVHTKAVTKLVFDTLSPFIITKIDTL